VFGLFKKVVIADNIAKLSSPVFDSLPLGIAPSTIAAWLAIFAYSLQLYFDFSGYSDMAVGLARMFNIKLPANFDSPYKARNFSEFWRRWHMTLSAFLRDHLYIPLGGNRGTERRVQLNLLITMLLGGLWHGAGWGFVVWGAVNGVLLLLHRNFRLLLSKLGIKKASSSWYVRELSITLTFVCIMLSRVTFRAPDWNSSVLMWQSLLGMVGNGISFATVVDLKFGICAAFLIYLVCRLMPNTQQMLAKFDPVLDAVSPSNNGLHWAPNRFWGILTAIAALACLLSLDHVSEFLYFQF
jgi:D-alanyl-lipoteichoic acid acyltransferase DltB (MBOAT superfamily)